MSRLCAIGHCGAAGVYCTEHREPDNHEFPDSVVFGTGVWGWWTHARGAVTALSRGSLPYRSPAWRWHGTYQHSVTDLVYPCACVVTCAVYPDPHKVTSYPIVQQILLFYKDFNNHNCR